MALTTVDYNSYFNYKLSQKQISFTDKTDFVSQGTIAANVKVLVKVTAPVSGVFYNNTNVATPDINCGTSLDSIITIPLPLDVSTGLPEQGAYSIQLTYIDSVVPATVIDNRSFTLNYTSPTVSLTMTADCIIPLLKSVDSTVYTKNLIDPTITRAMNINYPLSMNRASITGTSNSISTSVVYVVTGQSVEYSSRITSDLSYLFDIANSMYVIDQVLGSKFIPVSCDGDLCNIYCAIRSQYQRWQNTKKTNTIKANIELVKFEQITSIAEMVGTALRCGKGTHVSEYVAEILRIADADGGCACDDGKPQLVTGLGGSGSSTGVIVAEGVGVRVTSTSGGDSTTYTVALSTENNTKLSNIKNSIVTAGSGATVTSTSATVGGIQTETYVVSATDTVVDSLFVKVSIDFNTSSPPTISLLNQKKYGTLFGSVSQSTPGSHFVRNMNDNSFASWQIRFTNFLVTNFGAVSTTAFYPEVHFVESLSTATNILEDRNPLTVSVISTATGSFSFRFSDLNGDPVNGSFIQSNFERIQLIFKIQA